MSESNRAKQGDPAQGTKRPAEEPASGTHRKAKGGLSLSMPQALLRAEDKIDKLALEITALKHTVAEKIEVIHRWCRLYSGRDEELHDLKEKIARAAEDVFRYQKECLDALADLKTQGKPYSNEKEATFTNKLKDCLRKVDYEEIMRKIKE